MINRNELIKIGKFNKPHGIKGEIFFHFANGFFFKTEDVFFICKLKSIFIPFRVESYRFIFNSKILVKLKNIDTMDQVNLLSYQEVFSHQEQQLTKNTKLNSSKNSFSLDYFIGFNIIDWKIGEIGYVTDIDKATINTLFVVEKEGKEILIPTADELIVTVDDKQKIIYMKLPDGLISVN